MTQPTRMYPNDAAVYEAQEVIASVLADLPTPDTAALLNVFESYLGTTRPVYMGVELTEQIPAGTWHAADGAPEIHLGGQTYFYGAYGSFQLINGHVVPAILGGFGCPAASAPVDVLVHPRWAAYLPAPVDVQW